MMYSGCGELGFYGNKNSTVQIQQGTATSGYNCDFNDLFVGVGNGTGCYKYVPNKWVTFYYKIHLGDLNGGMNSSVQAYISMDGGGYQQFVNVSNLPLKNDGGGFNKYDAITLTPYMTGMKTPAGVDAHFFNPYAAVPSMHFGYALMIGVVAALLLHNWPLRAIALAYPAVVFFAIVGTANHYVVDSFGGAIAVFLGFAIAATWFRCARKPSMAPQR